MEIEEVKSKIEETRNRLDELNTKLFELENAERLEKFKNNVGKYFKNKIPVFGGEELIYIKSIKSVKEFSYFINGLTKTTFLIGTCLNSINLSDVFYYTDDFEKNYIEITKEDYYKKVEEFKTMLSKV